MSSPAWTSRFPCNTKPDVVNKNGRDLSFRNGKMYFSVLVAHGSTSGIVGL
jgi:hypothetical protein